MLKKSYMWVVISWGLSWLIKWATPSITTTSCKKGTSLLKPPWCTYSFTPGVVYVISRPPTTNLTGTLTCNPVHGAVSSQFLQNFKKNVKINYFFSMSKLMVFSIVIWIVRFLSESPSTTDSVWVSRGFINLQNIKWIIQPKEISGLN